MAKPLLDDELWEVIEPLLPPPKPWRFRFPGRKPLDNRKALTGILLVLNTGIPWESLPQEMGCGSGMTCWRRLRDWQEAGVWDRLQEGLLAKLQGAGKIDWNRAGPGQAGHRAWQWSGDLPLGGGTFPVLAASVPTLACALRATCGHSRGLRLPGLLPDLLELLVAHCVRGSKEVDWCEPQIHRD